MQLVKAPAHMKYNAVYRLLARDAGLLACQPSAQMQLINSPSRQILNCANLDWIFLIWRNHSVLTFYTRRGFVTRFIPLSHLYSSQQRGIKTQSFAYVLSLTLWKNSSLHVCSLCMYVCNIHVHMSQHKWTEENLRELVGPENQPPVVRLGSQRGSAFTLWAISPDLNLLPRFYPEKTPFVSFLSSVEILCTASSSPSFKYRPELINLRYHRFQPQATLLYLCDHGEWASRNQDGSNETFFLRVI